MPGIVDDTVNKMVDMRFADIPVGKGFVYAAAFGISDVAMGLIKKMVPGLDIVAAPGLAWLVKNINMIRNLLGNTGSEIVATAAMMEWVNSLIGVTSTVSSTLGNIVGVVPTVQPAALGSPHTTSPRYQIPEIAGLGQPFISPVEPETDVERKIRLNTT